MRALALLPLLLALSGCGGDERAPALARVELSLEAPADLSTVQDESVEVRGTVAPAGTRVLVAGQEADVSGGSFATTVELEEGENIIDVQADAPRRPAAMTALRVTRQIVVEVPPLEGDDVDDAIDALESVGLTADVDDVGSPLDDFFFGDDRVCATDPPAGDEVPAGTVVVLAVAGVC
ncbi:MAG: PASTA domain-containing protein [Solirubrobacteraceae bacterium]